MIDDFIKSMRASLYERTTSPLFGALAISWVLWNYRLFVILLSKMSADEKFRYIDEVLYPLSPKTFLIVLIGPLATAAIALFVYPYPARAVFRFWRNRQRELSAIKQQIEDETPLTIEQSREIRRQVISIQAEYDRQLQRGAEEERRLKQLIIDNQGRIAELENELRDTRAAKSPLHQVSASDEQIGEALRRRPFRLNYYTSNGNRKSRVMLFGPQGKILEGANDAENSWRVTNGFLETVRADGRVQGRFSYFPVSNLFVHTNDADTVSSKGQYLVPDDGALKQ